MARALRVQYEGAIYHVMNRGIARRELFSGSKDCERFLGSLALGVERTRVRMYAFGLMPNHYHLLVETPEANLSAFMLSAQTSYAVYFNQRYGKSGYVFEGPYRAKLVDGDDYLLKLSRYIDLNSIQTKAFKDKSLAEKVKALRVYPWGSYREYIGKAKRRDWIDYGPLESRVKEMGGSYRQYVEAGLAETDEDLEAMLKASPLAVGTEEFVEKVHARYEKLVNAAGRKEDVAFRHQGRWLGRDEIMNEVVRGLGLKDAEWGRRRGMAWSRGIAARMLIRYGGLTQRAAADVLGMSTGAAVCVRLRKLEEQRPSDRILARHISTIENRLDRRLTK